MMRKLVASPIINVTYYHFSKLNARNSQRHEALVRSLVFRSANNIEGKNDDFNGLTMELVYYGEGKSNVKKKKEPCKYNHEV
jgi:hypothetical protein